MSDYVQVTIRVSETYDEPELCTEIINTNGLMPKDVAIALLRATADRLDT